LVHQPSLAKLHLFDKKPVHFVDSNKHHLVNHKGKPQGRPLLDAEEIN